MYPVPCYDDQDHRPGHRIDDNRADCGSHVGINIPDAYLGEKTAYDYCKA